jgi:hypothetical protein
MNIDLHTIDPKVLAAKIGDRPICLLVCWNRIFKCGKTDEAGHGPPLCENWEPRESWDKVLFPVMIELPVVNNGRAFGISATKGCKVHYGVDGGDLKWTVFPSSHFGIEDHSARVAIAEAWRGVKESKLDAGNMLPYHHFDLSPMVEYKGGAARWMLNAWVRWDEWNRRGYNFPQKAKQLEKLGFKVTWKQLKNASDVRKLPKALKE